MRVSNSKTRGRSRAISAFKARASIAVVENPNVARYSGAVVYAIAVGLGMAGLVAVVSIVLVRSARAAKKKELEAAEAMARAWTDRAR